jgi:hypothetical protein
VIDELRLEEVLDRGRREDVSVPFDAHAEPVRRQETRQRVPVVPGKGAGAGGASSAAIAVSRAMRTTSPTAPPGSHALRTMRPCGAVTLAISAAAATGSGAKTTPNTESKTSTERPSTGIAPASPSAKVISRP